MDLSALLPALDQTVSLDRLRSRMSEAGALTLGVADGAKAAVLAALTRERATPTLIITPKSHHADALADELRAWLGDDHAARIHVFPERDALPYERLDPDPDDVTARLAVLDALSTRRPTTDADESRSSSPPPPRSPSAPSRPDELRRSTLTVAVGERLDQHRLLQVLDAGGYRIEPQVTAPGEASRRGGIVDVWPASEDNPLRIELFGDVVESIRAFDWASQRSVSTRERISIGSARELILDPQRMRQLAERLQPQDLRGDARAHAERDIEGLRSGEPFDGLDFYAPFLAAATLLDHAREANAQIIIDEPADIAAMQQEHDEMAHEARRDLERRGEIPHGLPEPHVPWPELRDPIEALPRRLNLSRWAVGESDAPDAGAAVRLPFAPVSAYGGRLRVLADELATTLRNGQQVVVVSTQSKRLSELLEEHDVFARLADAATEPTLGRGALTILHGSLPHGWSVGDEGRGLTLLTDAEVFGFASSAAPRPAAAPRAKASSPTSRPATSSSTSSTASRASPASSAAPSPARTTTPASASTSSCTTPKATASTCPSSRSTASRATSAPASTARPSRASARRSGRARSPASAAPSQELANDLLELYAQRELAQGHAFSPDGAWQTELEASFPYVETPDQLAAIRDVKRDMENAAPDGPPRLRRRRLRQDRGRHPRRLQGRHGRHAGRRPRADDRPRPAALQHLQRAPRRLPRARRDALPLPHRQGRSAPSSPISRGGSVDIVIGTHRLLQKDVDVQEPRPRRHRRGAALRRRPQGAPQADAQRGRRAHALGDADPAHAAHVARRHPRHVDHR